MKTKKFLTRHSPLILTIVGSVGVIGTALLSAYETPKAMTLLKDAEREKGESLTKVEMVVVAGPTYMPAIVLCVSTIFCFTSALYCSKRNQALLLSGYNLSKNAFKEYRKTLIDLYGEEADKKIYERMVRENYDFHEIGVEYPDKKVDFYEPISQTIFSAYEREVMDAEYHLNRNYVLRGYITVNEYLQFLGIDKIDDGDICGWSSDSGFYWIDFEHEKIFSEEYGDVIYQMVTTLEPEELE